MFCVEGKTDGSISRVLRNGRVVRRLAAHCTKCTWLLRMLYQRRFNQSELDLLNTNLLTYSLTQAYYVFLSEQKLEPWRRDWIRRVSSSLQSKATRSSLTGRRLAVEDRPVWEEAVAVSCFQPRHLPLKSTANNNTWCWRLHLPVTDQTHVVTKDLNNISRRLY